MNDFKKLAVMTHLSNKISLRSRSSRAFDEKFLKNEGPEFICVVRDFAFKEKLTAKQSLQRFLNLEPVDKEFDKSDEKQYKEIQNEKLKRNEIRQNMLHSFKTTNIFKTDR